MHEGRRPSCISFHLNVGRRPKGKDFGQWARVWNRQVARGAGLRYTRAKDLVKNRSTVAGLALPDVGAERIEDSCQNCTTVPVNGYRNS